MGFGRNVALFALVAVAATLPALSSAQDKVKLTLATGLSANVPTGWWVQEYIGPKLVEYSTKRIEVSIHTNATVCTEPRCVEQARLGQIDLGSISAANAGAFGTTFDILNLPYIFKDQAAAEKLMNGWLGQALKLRAEKELGLHVVTVIPSLGFRNLQNSKREVRVPADLNGIKIRVTKTPVELALLKTWGAVAVPYDWAGLYQALQNGVVDGMYIPNAYLKTGRFDELTKFVTVVGGVWNSHMMFLDKKRYDRLPDWAKPILARIGKEIDERSFEVDAEWEARETKALEGKVNYYRPTPKETELWYAGATNAWLAVKGTYDPAMAERALRDQQQDSLIKRLKEVGAL